MTYVTVTTWKMADGVDRASAIQRAKDAHMPAIKSMGASSQRLVELNTTESLLITEWPDQATRDAATKRIEEMRSAVRDEGAIQLTGDYRGEVIHAV